MNKEVLWWKFRNIPNFLRSFPVLLTAKFAPWCGGLITIYGKVYIRKWDSTSNKWVDFGFASARMVTTAGVQFMSLGFKDGSKDISTMKYHASGTGVVAEAVGDVALGTEVIDNARTAGTNTNSASGSNYIYQSVNTISYTGIHAITEHGLFNQIVVAGSTLWDRSVFAAINVGVGDSIQFTYQLTITAGG